MAKEQPQAIDNIRRNALFTDDEFKVVVDAICTNSGMSTFQFAS